jgi:hypothetical protein
VASSSALAPGGAGVAGSDTAFAVGTDSVVAMASGAVTATAAALLDAEPTAERHVVTREEQPAADSVAELLGVVDSAAELLGVVDSAAAAMVAAVVDTAKIDLRG